MAKEIERLGLPTALISALVPLAASVGANRIVEGKALTHPLGDLALSRAEERQFRRMLLLRSLDALKTVVPDQLIVKLVDR